MKGIFLELSNGHFNIEAGAEFAADGGGLPLLCFEENGIMNVITNPDGGELYDGKIIIPRDIITESITIKLKCCSVTAAEMNTGIFTANISESSAEFFGVKARRINVSAGRSCLTMNIAPLIGAEFTCGFGEVKLNLMKNRRGYLYRTQCGAGQLTINSKRQKRSDVTGAEGGVPVNIKCGLGNVEVQNN